MNLSPIVIFVYNRPWHTEQTLEALSKNTLADKSHLIVYCDGPKKGDDQFAVSEINAVRTIVRSKQWCKEVEIIEATKNIGLADSIISGVTKILDKYGKIIVLEDDLVTSKGFLKYMNDALNFYDSEEKVMHVSGYMLPVNGKLPETFFYNVTSCWGWGTWDNAWRKLNVDENFLIKEIEKRDLKSKFNMNGNYDFFSQLELNRDKKLFTWAIKWYASFFLNDGYALHPAQSLVNNIGHDSSGVHSASTDIYSWRKLSDKVSIKKIKIEPCENAFNLAAQFYGEIFFPSYKSNLSFRDHFYLYRKKVLFKLKKYLRFNRRI